MNEDNPYRAPASAPNDGRLRIGIVLAVLAVPAASIAGGITCSTARLAAIPTGQPDYAHVPSQLLEGVTAGMLVAYAVWRLLRSCALHWQSDQPPWPPIVASGWILAAAIPTAMFLAYGAFWLGLWIGEAMSPSGAASIFLTATTSSAVGFATLLLAWQSYRYGK
jgi:hypothetical protein